NWGNGFLPAHYQGTTLRPKGSPILDLQPPQGITRDHQRANLDLLATLNRENQEAHPWHEALAFRMQMSVPGILDLSKEDAKLKESYGIGKEPTDSFGRKCLRAPRIVEH